MLADLVIKGLFAHVVADWLLQNDWMANNKGSLLHPAAWVHGGLHLALLLPFFPVTAALGLAVAHVLIDTRVPLRWWARLWRKSANGPIMTERALWEDQALHFVLITIVAWLVAG